MRSASWEIRLDPPSIFIAFVLSLIVVIGFIVLSTLRSRRSSQSLAEYDSPKRPTMKRASFWVTLVALLVGVFATLAMFSGNEHAAIFARPGEGIYARSGQGARVSSGPMAHKQPPCPSAKSKPPLPAR